MKKDYKKEYNELLSILQEVMETVLPDVGWKDRNYQFNDEYCDADAVSEIYEVVAARTKKKRPKFIIKAGDKQFKWYDYFEHVADKDAIFIGVSKEGKLVTGKIYRTWGELITYVDNTAHWGGMRTEVKLDRVTATDLIQDIGKAMAKKLECTHYWQILGTEINLLNENPKLVLMNGTLTLAPTEG